MHLDTRKMSINPMEIIENGLRLFIDRSSCSSGEETSSMTIKNVIHWRLRIFTRVENAKKMEKYLYFMLPKVAQLLPARCAFA